MRRVVALTVALSKEYLRNRQAAFFALVFPVVLLLIFGAVFGGGATEFTVHVQNNDRTEDGGPTELSRAYIESLEAAEPLSVEYVDYDRNLTEWHDERRGTEPARVVVVPEGFEQRVERRSTQAQLAVTADTLDRFNNRVDADQRAAFEANITAAQAEFESGDGPATVRLYASPDDEAADAILGILRSHLGSFNERAIGVEDSPTTVKVERFETDGRTAVDYYLPAFIAAIVMFNGIVSVTQYVSEFDRRGTLKRLVATPLRKRDWILANLIQQSVLALVLTVVMVAVAALVYDVTAVPGPLALTMVVVGAVAFTAIGLALGSIVRDPNAAVSLGLAVALPLMFMSGVFWEVELMPPAIQAVAEFMPLLYFHRGLRNLIIVGTTDGVALPFVVLGLVAVAGLSVAVRFARWRDFE